jgi:SNF2 family DNA or RNA helicase
MLEVSSAAETDSEQTENETIKLADFLEEWGDTLKAQVLRNMQPVYSGKTEDEWDRQARVQLQNLLRTAFPGQITKGILPVAKAFYHADNKAAFLVGEMGAGKSFMGLAVLYLMPQKNKRVLIQCPGHLVHKWIREAKMTIPDCTCVNLNGKSLDVLLANKLARTTPKGTEIWVMGKERAKLHYQRVRQWMKIQGQPCCPACGASVDPDSLEVCIKCRARMWAADKDRVRRYAKAEFIKRYLPNNFFDLLILDEVHELKGGGTAQGQSMSCLIARSKKILALTGTLMGGYSKDLYYLLWRMFPRWMKAAGLEYGRALQFAERYGVIERTYDSKDLSASLNAASIGRKIGGRHRIKEMPGISPLLLPDLLLERSAFVRLEDINEALPAYDEMIVSVDMEGEQRENYCALEAQLTEETRKSMALGDMRMLGKMLQTLLAYPDGCRAAERVTLEVAGIEKTVGFAPSLKVATLPKEKRLLEIMRAEQRQGRKVAIFVEHTGTRDLLPIMEAKLKEEGFSPLILRGQAVAPEHREAWLEEHMNSGNYDCLMCNPNLVKTGLDLLEFPTIIFFQCGYSVYTLRQASRRSWRIGQEHPVRVFFMAYGESMQDKALSLIAQKMETSLAVEGVLSEQGLAALSESENSIVMELAKALIGKNTVADVNEAWTKYKQQSLLANLNLDDPEDMTVTTTTTITSSAGTATISYQYVVRGKVKQVGNQVMVYVGRNRFDLNAGKVLWSGRVVGFYDKKGFGEINGKPIRIYKPSGKPWFVLAEVHEVQMHQ